jgi:hypothetical protein
MERDDVAMHLRREPEDDRPILARPRSLARMKKWSK